MKGITLTILFIFLGFATTPLTAQLYLRGTFNGWNTDHYLTSHGDSTWTTQSVFIAAGAHELKIATSDWSLAYGDGSGNLTGTVLLNPVGNRSLSIDSAGFYDLFFDEAALTYSLTRSPYTSTNKLMYARGSFNGWGTNQRMALIGNRTWKTAPIAMTVSGYEMKFANHPDWQGVDWGGSNGLSGTASITTGGGPNILFVVASDGNYEITFNDTTLAYSISLAVTSLIDQPSVSQNPIRVFPNPAQNLIEISLPVFSAGMNQRLEVLDATGKVWMEKTLSPVASGSNLTLSVAALPAGVYLVRMGIVPPTRFIKQ